MTAPPLPPLSTLRRIGGGESADVFLLPPDRALKLLRPRIPAAIARREFAAAGIAHAAGLPTPAPLMLAEIDGRHGIVFERLPESPLLRRARRLPGAVMVTIAAMARAQAALHQIVAPATALAWGHDVVSARLDESLAPLELVSKARAALDRLPHRNCLLHGDLHLGNIITSRGKTMIVDWSQAMTGDPAADVARTELVMRFGRYGWALRDHAWLRPARHAAAAWYLVCYRRITGMDEERIEPWRLPLAAAWLRPGSAAHAPSLRRYLERRWAADQLR